MVTRDLRLNKNNVILFLKHFNVSVNTNQLLIWSHIDGALVEVMVVTDHCLQGRGALKGGFCDTRGEPLLPRIDNYLLNIFDHSGIVFSIGVVQS